MIKGRKPIDKSKIRKILIRATNWVGDMVISLPALEAVRENFPESRIVVLALPWVLPILDNHPAVDQVISFNKGNGYTSYLMGLLRTAGMIRKLNFDLAILFQNAFEAALLAYLGNIKYRVGYNTDGRSFLLTHPVNKKIFKKGSHEVEYYLLILRAMGWNAIRKDPRLIVGSEHMEVAGSILQSKGINKDDLLLGLSPGAIFGPAKRWPAENFAAIGDYAADRWGAKVIIFGSKNEREICDSVANSMKNPCINICGRTDLMQAAAILKMCQYFVTNDSGLMHVAAAMEVPMIAIFGSTDHIATGPLSRKAKIVRHNTACAPCLKPECEKDFQCMLGIYPDDIWKELEILKEESY